MGERAEQPAYEQNQHEQIVDELTDVSLSLLAALRQTGSLVFGSLGLTYGQAMLLVFVEQGFTRPKDLTELLGVVFPAFSSLVTNLVGAGLLVRELDQKDGRRVEIHLTPLGSETCSRIRTAWRESSVIDVSGCSAEQLEAFLEVARAATKRTSL